MDAILITAVVGVVELIKRLFDKDYRAAAIIAGAAVVGGLFGYFEWVQGVTVPEGLVIGLGASGLVNVVEKVGKQK